MPVSRSAKKAFRQTIRRRAKNLGVKKTLSETVKKYKKSPSAELLAAVYQKLDKAAKVNVIKKNRAARLKSRLSKLLGTRASHS